MKTIKMHGNISAEILIIGEAPGEVEVNTGIPMSGPQGGVLYRHFTDILQTFYRLFLLRLL